MLTLYFLFSSLVIFSRLKKYISENKKHMGFALKNACSKGEGLVPPEKQFTLRKDSSCTRRRSFSLSAIEEDP